MKRISGGAEAEIYLDGSKIIKKRIPKSYRIKEIDVPLRKTRTRKEAKILEKLPKEVLHPSLIKMDDTEMNIEMDFIPGDKVRDILDKKLDICEEIGEKIALMHNSGIVHGDLTTSNMILCKGKVYLIDFGLSYFTDKIEDMAVDLHLLKQALESKHYKIFEKAFKLMMEGYKSKSKNYSEIKKRFDIVELRGRNKAKF